MRILENTDQVDFDKAGGLVPAIVQDVTTQKVLMLGYMSKEALTKTLETGKVTFFSRSKQRLWTKGESSGNYLNLKQIAIDCDNDTLLVKALPDGPTCHRGTDTCFEEDNHADTLFLDHLTSVIKQRRQSDPDQSYTARLFQKGINKMAQKVGEEAVELVIEAKDDNEELFLNEGADLLFHYMILLEAKGYSLKDIISVLRERHK